MNKNYLVLLIITIILTGCGPKETKTQESVSISANKDTITLSNEALNAAQLEILTIKSCTHQIKITTTGEIKADENRVFHINSIVAGRVIKDNVVLGKTIEHNQELAVIQNLDLAKTYGEYIHQSHQNNIDIAQAQARLDLAKKNAQRLRKLSQEGIVAEKDLLAAENQQKICEIDIKGLREHATHIKAESKELLAAYGISLEEQEKKGAEHIDSGSPLLAPKSGVVIQKNITVGDVVTPSQPLYVVADLSQVWLDITVYDKDLQKIKEGESISFRSDSLPGHVFTGTISYIQPAAGDTTRTFLARAILPNPQLILKPGMFGQVEITGKDSHEYPYVPDAALQKYGSETFVFVEQDKNTFVKHKVELGDRIEDGYLIIHGVAAGEQIVGAGSFKLKSELLKSELNSEN